MNKNHGIVRYLEFLVARDGDADLLRHRLSKREAFFDNLARSPVSAYALIDRATYFRNMARRRSEPGLEPRMLWILATAKANRPNASGWGSPSSSGASMQRIPHASTSRSRRLTTPAYWPTPLRCLACRCPRVRREFSCAL